MGGHFIVSVVVLVVAVAVAVVVAAAVVGVVVGMLLHTCGMSGCMHFLWWWGVTPPRFFTLENGSGI